MPRFQRQGEITEYRIREYSEWEGPTRTIESDFEVDGLYRDQRCDLDIISTMQLAHPPCKPQHFYLHSILSISCLYGTKE